MIRSILYATDLGLYAPYVLQHALSLTRAYNAELYVVHVVEPLGLFAESVLQTLTPSVSRTCGRKGWTTSWKASRNGSWKGFAMNSASCPRMRRWSRACGWCRATRRR